MIGRTNTGIGGSGTIQLNAPRNLSITGTTLSWSLVAGATSYKVYKDGTLFDTVDTNSCSLASITTVGSYYMQVVASASGYTDSIYSQGIYYGYQKLLAPTGLSKNGSILSWNAVLGATSYRVYCTQLGQSWTTSSTSMNMSSYLTGTGTYNLEVKATASGYADSDWSATFYWQGGVSTYSVMAILLSEEEPTLGVVVNGRSINSSGYEFTAQTGQTLTLEISFVGGESGRAARWSYSTRFAGYSDSGTTYGTDVYVQLSFNSTDRIEFYYEYI